MKKTIVLLGCLLLAACQSAVRPVNDALNLQRQIERETLLQKQADWGFRGRVAISDGDQAGTVKMVWRQQGEQFDIEISMPISNQKYRLRKVGNAVRLESHGIAALEGSSAEAVLVQATGWRIPFDDMQLWLRGMRSDGATTIAFGPDGLPAQFRENGWLVDYRAWYSAVTPMPQKVFASTVNNGKNASVRLQIESWETQ